MVQVFRRAFGLILAVGTSDVLKVSVEWNPALRILPFMMSDAFTFRNLVVAVATCLLLGCSSSTPVPETVSPEVETASFDTQVSRLKLGMSRAQVTAIMGYEGDAGGKSQTTQGTFETVYFMPNFGQRYSTALKRQFSLGFAGRSDPDGAAVGFKNGRVFTITSH